MKRMCLWPMVFFSVSLGSDAIAKDLEMLTRLLIPAYMAQNFAVLCVDQDAQFLSSLNNGPLVNVFAEHVKREITIELPESEAANVRVTAADTARTIARDEMRLLGGQPSSGVPAEALKRWCDRSAKHFILEIMRKHQEKHNEFDRLVEAAKR